MQVDAGEVVGEDRLGGFPPLAEQCGFKFVPKRLMEATLNAADASEQARDLHNFLLRRRLSKTVAAPTDKLEPTSR
ncbi:MAG: hypothetical protein QM714_03605 [Nocardioides sp.]